MAVGSNSGSQCCSRSDKQHKRNTAAEVTWLFSRYCFALRNKIVALQKGTVESLVPNKLNYVPIQMFRGWDLPADRNAESAPAPGTEETALAFQLLTLS